LRICSWEFPEPRGGGEATLSDGFAAELAEGAAEGGVGDAECVGLAFDVARGTGAIRQAIVEPVDGVLAFVVGSAIGA
jgi:hypothetical protein